VICGRTSQARLMDQIRSSIGITFRNLRVDVLVAIVPFASISSWPDTTWLMYS
jgi:hypothetical protein